MYKHHNMGMLILVESELSKRVAAIARKSIQHWSRKQSKAILLLSPEKRRLLCMEDAKKKT